MSFFKLNFFVYSGSSQTWLQVQQQRLRAKRAQRQQEGFDFTDGAISRYASMRDIDRDIRLMPLYHFRRSQTLSPVRQHYSSNYTLTTGKEPKFVQVKRTTEQQAVTRPYKVG